MHAGVLRIHFLASQTLPEVDLLPIVGSRLTGHHPGVRALTVGTNAHVSIQTETKQEVAKKNSMVLGVAASLNVKMDHLLGLRRLALNATLLLSQRLVIPASGTELATRNERRGGASLGVGQQSSGRSKWSRVYRRKLRGRQSRRIS